MEIRYLTSEHVYLIHQQAIKEFGGDLSYFDNTNHKIESILAQQFPYFGYDKYPTIFEKAAMLMYFFTKDHCFVDGNKRVGLDSAVVFLTVNGYEDYMEASYETKLEAYKKVMEMADSHFQGTDVDMYISQLAEWLECRFWEL